MTVQETKERLAGWLLAGVVAVALLCAAAAIALAAERQAPVLFLDLAALPPAAPALAAFAEAAPQVAEQAPAVPDEPATDEPAPEHPDPDSALSIPAAARLSLPIVEVPVTADLALPSPSEKPAPEAETAVENEAAKADLKPTPEKRKTAEEPRPDIEAKTERRKETASASASASASAPKVTGKTKSGGATSPAAYAKAVMKKVRSTKRKPGAGKGTVVVGFTIGTDGNLVGVKVLQSSGNTSLDKTALDHIGRSAPFPMPPEGAARSFSFEFVGK